MYREYQVEANLGAQKIQRFLSCVSCVEADIQLFDTTRTITQILEYIDPARMTALSISALSTSTPATADAFQNFTHLRRLDLCDATVAPDFFPQMIGPGSPLTQLEHISYHHSAVKAIDLTLLIRLLRNPVLSGVLKIRSIKISTTRANEQWHFAPPSAVWSGESAKEDTVELIRLGKERGITIGGTNVEAVEIEQRNNEKRWNWR
jgi:hypothetical protein